MLPGVGAFGRCMEALDRTGLDEHGPDRPPRPGRPFLGICVGMQLLYEGSEETPGVAGLGVPAGRVGACPTGVKHPQMQWNLDRVGSPALLAGLASDPGCTSCTPSPPR